MRVCVQADSGASVGVSSRRRVNRKGQGANREEVRIEVHIERRHLRVEAINDKVPALVVSIAFLHCLRRF